MYEAAGGNEPSLRAYQRAAQLDPKSVAVARGLERTRNTVVTPLGATPTGATPTLGPDGTPKLNGGGGSKGGKVFEMSLEQMDKEWEAIGLDCVKSQEWYNLRRKACPHGVLVAIVDAVENNDAMKAWKDEQLTENDITTEEYTEKEHFAERAMSLFAKKRHEGLPIPQDSTWLDLAFEAVNIDSLTPLEQAKICLCMANIFCWCGDFVGADELYDVCARDGGYERHGYRPLAPRGDPLCSPTARWPACAWVTAARPRWTRRRRLRKGPAGASGWRGWARLCAT